MIKKLCVVGLVLVGQLTVAHAATEHDWPTHTVKVVVPFPAGGGVDNLARQLAEQLSAQWGQSVVVENKPGASTIIGANAVVNSTDRHTLFLTTDATFTVNPNIRKKLGYALGDNLFPVALVAEFDQMLVGNSKFETNSLAKILEEGKGGKEYTYASYGSGSEPQLAIEMFKHLSGLNILHVPYKGVPQALNGVVAGEVDFTTSGTKTIEPLVKSGKLKAIAFTGDTRDELFNEVKTFEELGFKGVDANVTIGLFAPDSLPAESRDTIRKSVETIQKDPGFQQKAIKDRGFHIPKHDNTNLQAFFQAKSQQRAELVKIANISVE